MELFGQGAAVLVRLETVASGQEARLTRTDQDRSSAPSWPPITRSTRERS